MSTNKSDPDQSVSSQIFDPEEVLRKLRDSGDRLPVDAILEAREHREVMIPLLIQSIEDATAQIRETGETPKGSLHFYALFLLTEFRATEAWEAIVESISLPGELPLDLYGDALTDCLDRILAEMVDGVYERLDNLIADKRIQHEVRQPAIYAYLYLIREGLLTRESVLERLRPVVEAELRSESQTEITLALLFVMLDLGASEFSAELLQIFDRSEIDEYTMIREDLTESFARENEDVMQEIRNLRPAGIPDTIEELENWAWFDGESDDNEWDDEEFTDAEREVWERAKQYVLEHELAGLMPDEEPHIDTIRNESPRVGRNDPCPCGSGKKHKKCCWSS